jgi:SAM-dependent methyltransferase
MKTPDCKICGSRTVDFGEKTGSVIPTTFRFSRCESCSFISVINPCLDFARLYDQKYYQGKGADPYVDYEFELEHPDRTVRRYEWRGIHEIVRRLAPDLASDLASARWLDYGCGNGGLVRYLRARNVDAVGFDEGSIVDVARRHGIPIKRPDEIESEAGQYSIVTMIEVIEHIPDPVPLLRKVRELIKPGGLLFLTTGNAAPQRNDFLNWRYVVPDIHVSFFDPENMKVALAASGFRTESPGFASGWEDVVRFKLLKTLGVRRSSVWEQMIPWKPAARLVDRKVRLSDYPVGYAI